MRDLVERAQGGDREAFGALVAMISDRTYGLAAADPPRWDELLAQAMPIVESFVFAEP